MLCKCNITGTASLPSILSCFEGPAFLSISKHEHKTICYTCSGCYVSISNSDLSCNGLVRCSENLDEFASMISNDDVAIASANDFVRGGRVTLFDRDRYYVIGNTWT